MSIWERFKTRAVHNSQTLVDWGWAFLLFSAGFAFLAIGIAIAIGLAKFF